MSDMSVQGFSRYSVQTFSASIAVPEYLLGDNIVIATDAHSMSNAAFHRWAEPMSDGIERSLRDTLGLVSPNAQLKGVDIAVTRFHGDVDGNVVLQASWRAKPNCGQSISGEFAETMRQSDNGYSSLVATHRLLVMALARNISEPLNEHSCQGHKGA